MFYCHELIHPAGLILILFCQEKLAEAETDLPVFRPRAERPVTRTWVGTEPRGQCTVESKLLSALLPFSSRVNHEPTVSA